MAVAQKENNALWSAGHNGRVTHTRQEYCWEWGQGSTKTQTGTFCPTAPFGNWANSGRAGTGTDLSMSLILASLVTLKKSQLLCCQVLQVYLLGLWKVSSNSVHPVVSLRYFPPCPYAQLSETYNFLSNTSLHFFILFLTCGKPLCQHSVPTKETGKPYRNQFHWNTGELHRTRALGLLERSAFPKGARCYFTHSWHITQGKEGKCSATPLGHCHELRCLPNLKGLFYEHVTVFNPYAQQREHFALLINRGLVQLEPAKKNLKLPSFYEFCSIWRQSIFIARQCIFLM